MKLLTEAEARTALGAEVFVARYPWQGASLLTFGLTLAGVVITLYHVWGPLLILSYQPIFLPWWLGSLFLVIGAVIYNYTRAAFQPSAWLVRTDGSSIFIKFRSFLHWRRPRNDNIVLKADVHDIERVIFKRETISKPQPRLMGFETKPLNCHFEYLYIFLHTPLDEDTLIKIIDESTQLPDPSFKGHYFHSPLGVSEDRKVLRVSWGYIAGRAWPAATQLITTLAPRAMSGEWPSDYTYVPALRPIRGVDKAALANLVQTGKKPEAIRLLRQWRGYTRKEAKERLALSEYE